MNPLSLKQQQFNFSQIWSPEVETKALAGLASLETLWKDLFHGSSSFWWWLAFLGFLGLWPHCSATVILASVFTFSLGVFPSMCPC